MFFVYFSLFSLLTVTYIDPESYDQEITYFSSTNHMFTVVHALCMTVFTYTKAAMHDCYTYYTCTCIVCTCISLSEIPSKSHKDLCCYLWLRERISVVHCTHGHISTAYVNCVHVRHFTLCLHLPVYTMYMCTCTVQCTGYIHCVHVAHNSYEYLQCTCLMILKTVYSISPQDVDLTYIAKITKGFSGADLTEICQRVHNICFI